jgi:hypothetical protein
MKKNIHRLLQIGLLALAAFATYGSIGALKGDADYCAGMYCDSNQDCGSACFCNGQDHTCYDLAEGRSTI